MKIFYKKIYTWSRQRTRSKVDDCIINLAIIPYQKMMCQQNIVIKSNVMVLLPYIMNSLCSWPDFV